MDENTSSVRKQLFETLLTNGWSPPYIKNNNGSIIQKVASLQNVSKESIKSWLKREKKKKINKLEHNYPNWDIYSENNIKSDNIIEYQKLPKDDIPINEILDILKKRNSKRLENASAKEWQIIKINSNKPCVIAFVGDPHIDDNGCDIKLLRKHTELMSLPDVYAFNVGDTTNNWVGNLMRLYKDQDTSIDTAHKLIKWFMNESGINWLGWVTGNHDLWNEGHRFIKLMNTNGILIEDWTAKLKLQFPSNLEVPIWISHDFKGKSQFNKVHGALKTARERRGAAIYACGHTHDFGYYMEEHPDTGEIVHAIRSRGYKFNDSYALQNGFAESKNGATMAVVIDPNEQSLNDSITVFACLEKAIKFKNSL